MAKTREPRNCALPSSTTVRSGPVSQISPAKPEPPAARYDLVVGIQVFQHGTRAQAHRHLAAAAGRVRPGGLLCVRVNAAGTDIEHAHRRFEEDDDGSFSVRYRSGPKAGLDIHFFAGAELTAVVGGAFDPVLPPRRAVTWRTLPGRGQWSQWEAIWLRR